MLEQINKTLQQVTAIEWTVLLMLIIGGLIYARWEQLKFFRRRAFYSFPLIGKLARLEKDDSRDGSGRWYRSEIELCADFHEFCPQAVSRADFEQATKYLQRAQELGRKHFPWFGWVIVFILLVAEALSFGTLLAGYIAQNATLSQQSSLGYLAALVLAIVLLWLTHHTGRELYLNSLRGKVREWHANRSRAEQDIALRPNSQVSLNDNNVDDADPMYIQLASRIEGGGKYRPAYVWTVFSAIVIVLIGGGAYYVRAQLLNEIETETATTPLFADDTAAAESSGDSLSAIDQMNMQAGARAKEEQQAAARNGALAAFGVLSLLFVAMQAVGVSMGFGFGFAGKESAEARAIRGSYATVDQFERGQRAKRDAVIRVVQAKLSKLQRRIRARTTTADSDEQARLRTFQRYISETQHDAQLLAKESAKPAPVIPAAPQPAPVAAAVQAEDPEAAMRERIQKEVRAKLAAEQREAQIRREIEAAERQKLGLDPS